MGQRSFHSKALNPLIFKQSSSRLVSGVCGNDNKNKLIKNRLFFNTSTHVWSMSQTNLLEGCLKICVFRVILTGKGPLSHLRPVIKLTISQLTLVELTLAKVKIPLLIKLRLRGLMSGHQVWVWLSGTSRLITPTPGATTWPTKVTPRYLLAFDKKTIVITFQKCSMCSYQLLLAGWRLVCPITGNTCDRTN